QPLARRPLDAQRRRLRAQLGLQPLAVGVERALLVLRLVELGEEASRFVRDAHQVETAHEQDQQEEDVEPGHAAAPAPSGTSVRSATRITAERARGLVAASVGPGLTRPRARNRCGRGAANGARRSNSLLLSRAMKVLTILSSSEWKLMTTSLPPGASSASAAFRACSSSSSSALTKIRRA